MAQMRPIAIDATCRVVYVSVCVLVTLMYCAKTAEPIEMPFGRLTRVGVGPRNHVLNRVQIPKGVGAILGVCPAH